MCIFFLFLKTGKQRRSTRTTSWHRNYKTQSDRSWADFLKMKRNICPQRGGSTWQQNYDNIRQVDLERKEESCCCSRTIAWSSAADSTDNETDFTAYKKQTLRWNFLKAFAQMAPSQTPDLPVFIQPVTVRGWLGVKRSSARIAHPLSAA